MIKFISVRTKPQQDQNNLNILVDNNIYQQYFNAGQNLIIEAEFANTIIQEIILHLYPNPDKEILYKCFNLNELDQEYKIISGKLNKSKNEQHYFVYTATIKSEVPHTRLRITIQNTQIDYFQIYYFGVRGKNIEEEVIQQKGQESFEKKTIKVIVKPGRKTENFNNKIVDNANMTPSEFFYKVKNGKPISNREKQSISFEEYDGDKMRIEQNEINQQSEQFSMKLQEESKVKDDPESRKYITLYDDDENSVQFIDEKVKQQQIQQQINKNHYFQQKCCFSDYKPQANNKTHTKQLSITKFTSQQKTIEDQDHKTEQNVFNNMIKFTASDIDQEFLQFHKAIEESRNIPAKYRLIHRLNTQQY